MKNGKGPEYCFTRSPDVWLRVMDWFEMKVGNLYGAVINRPDVTPLQLDTAGANGHRNVYEIHTFEEYVKREEPKLNQALNEENERLKQDIAVRRRAYGNRR